MKIPGKSTRAATTRPPDTLAKQRAALKRQFTQLKAAAFAVLKQEITEWSVRTGHICEIWGTAIYCSQLSSEGVRGAYQIRKRWQKRINTPAKLLRAVDWYCRMFEVLPRRLCVGGKWGY